METGRSGTTGGKSFPADMPGLSVPARRPDRGQPHHPAGRLSTAATAGRLGSLSHCGKADRRHVPPFRADCDRRGPLPDPHQAEYRKRRASCRPSLEGGWQKDPDIRTSAACAASAGRRSRSAPWPGRSGATPHDPCERSPASLVSNREPAPVGHSSGAILGVASNRGGLDSSRTAGRLRVHQPDTSERTIVSTLFSSTYRNWVTRGNVRFI